MTQAQAALLAILAYSAIAAVIGAVRNPHYRAEGAAMWFAAWVGAPAAVAMLVATIINLWIALGAAA